MQDCSGSEESDVGLLPLLGSMGKEISHGPLLWTCGIDVRLGVVFREQT